MSNQTKSSFDTKAADWDKKKRRIALAEEVSGAIKSLLGDNTELDAMEYGCGTGLVGLMLAPQLQSLLAVDTSDRMLEVLQQKLDEQKITNVSTKNFNLLTGDLAQKFDLIFCAMTLHHVDNSKLLLEKFCQQLNPGGLLAVADLDEEDGSFHQGDAPGHHHNGFKRDDLQNIVEQNGLGNIEFSSIHTIMRKNTEGVEKPFSVFLLTGKK